MEMEIIPLSLLLPKRTFNYVDKYIYCFIDVHG